jgi:hypothetical protein
MVRVGTFADMSLIQTDDVRTEILCQPIDGQSFVSALTRASLIDLAICHDVCSEPLLSGMPIQGSYADRMDRIRKECVRRLFNKQPDQT